MTGDDTEQNDGNPSDERRRARRAQIEAEQAHGEQLLARYGREDHRRQYASVGHAGAKRRRS
jgi:hypothetical protein